MEVGWGRIYNQNWPYSTHVAELDANRNSDIYQVFLVGKEAHCWFAYNEVDTFYNITENKWL